MKRTKLCRICTNLINDRNIYKLFDCSQDWIAKIEELTGLLLKNSKNLPEVICKACKEDLERSYEFRNRCISAQNYFCSEAFIGSESFGSNADTKGESTQSPDDLIIAGDYCKTELGITDELPIDTKNVAEFCLVKTEKEDILNADEDSHCYSDGSDTLSKNSVQMNTGKLNLDKNSEESVPIVKKRNRNRVKGSKENLKNCEEKNKKDTQRKLKTEIGSNTFVCDQCGIHFDRRSKFLLHQRRHAGDKQYHCEICPEQFFLHKQLKRHIRKHTGERPFACKYCERRFIDRDQRNRHERATHTNVRPFSCTECSRAFPTSYLLKRHMMSHTGERSFRCYLCNKSFGRKYHLDTHYKSMQHKKNIEKQLHENKMTLESVLPIMT